MNRPTAGTAATVAERAHALDVAAASAVQLTNVRNAAAKWQTGLAGLTGTIAIFGLVQGRDDVDALPAGWGIAYGVCLAAALACSIGGGVLAMRAAFGLPKVMSTSMGAGSGNADADEARQSAGLLHAAIWLTVASIVAVAATLAVAWYARDTAPDKLRVHRSSGSEDCGTVVRASGGALILRTDTGERQIALSDVDGIKPVSSCSGGG